MERLTYRTEYGYAVSYGACSGVSCKSCCDKCGIGKLIDRLAAYEDTGYEPEQIERAFEDSMDAMKAHLWDVEQELKAYKDTGLEPEEIEGLLERGTPLEGGTAELMKKYLSIGSVDHLMELAQAEKDGRLVVLDEPIALAVAAGARAIENNKRLEGVTYVYDLWGEKGGPKEITYYQAAKLLRGMANPALNGQKAEEALRKEAEYG